MTLYKRREKFSRLSEKIGRTFGFFPASVYTALALLLTLASAYFLLVQNFLCTAIFFAIAAFFDMVDGAVARYRKEVSSKGAYFDTVADRYMEGIIALSMILVALPSFYMPSYFWASLYLFGSFMTTYAKSAAAEKGLKKEIKGGILERSDRMIILFIGLLLAYFNPVYLTYVLALLTVLTNISALQRIRIAAKNDKS